MANSQQHDQKGVIAWFVHNPVAANLLMAIILFAGIATAINLRIEGFPSTDPTAVTVDVTYESGDVRQVEEAIAVKVEQALLGSKGIKNITSTSTTNGATIQIESTTGCSLDKLTADIKNKVDGINSFPLGAERPIVSQQQWEESALWISLYGQTDQNTLQKVTQQFEVALLALPGVNKVDRSGWKTPEIAIKVDEQVLQSYQLTLEQLGSIIASESLSRTSGELRSEDGTILLKADQQRYYYQDFAEIIVVLNPDGSEIRLADIAQISDGFAETPKVLSRFKGLPAINLQIQVDRDANIVLIAEQAKELVSQWQNTQKLPQGMAIELWMDQSINMLERLSLVIENGLIGIALVMLVLAIFLNLKVAFWVGMGLPVCFAGGLLLMGESFFDLTLNQLTTFGFVLVLGILVDDAVVVGESVYSAQQRLGNSVDSTIAGVKKVAMPTMFGVLTTVAAFYPLSFVDGRLGSLFSQFAYVCTACLLFSLVESKFILPAHLRNLNTTRKSANHWPGKVLSGVQNKADQLMLWLNCSVYRPAIKQAIKLRYAVLALFLSVLVLVLGLVPSGKVAFSFFPDIPEELVTVSFKAQQGIGYGVAHAKVDEIEAVVNGLNKQWQQQYPDEPEVISRMYSQVTEDVNGTITLELSPRDKRSLPAMDIAAQLNEQIGLSEGLREIIVSLDDHNDKDFVLTLLSNESEQLQQASKMTLQVLSKINGVVDIYDDLNPAQSQLVFKLTAEGRSLGLTTEDLAKQIQQNFYGVEVQRVQRGKEEVRVRVIYPEEQRRDITDLQQARIRVPSGQVVALSTVATYKVINTVTHINRRDGYRAGTVSANINQHVTDTDAVYELLETTLFQQLETELPNVQIIKDGDASEEREASGSLVLIFAFSLLLIYILVAVPLKSYWQPIVIMSAIPFGIVGAVLGHWYMGLAISILSINGILALSGVVVNDSLLLINQYNELRKNGSSAETALVEAGSLRMRAILLTSLTTCLGLYSLLQESSEQAQFLIPAATSLAFGICFATLVSLILVPVVMMISLDVKKLLLAISPLTPVNIENHKVG